MVANVDIASKYHEKSITRVQLQTHSLCNGACTICPYSDTIQYLPQGKMDWNLFCKIIDELTTFPNIQTISLMLQNEPLLNRDIGKEIAFVKTHMPKVTTSVTTNGMCLDRIMIDTLSNTGLDNLVVSINGLTKASFEKIGQNLHYETVMNNLYNLIEHAPYPNMCIAVKSMMVKDTALEFGLPDKFSDLPKLLLEKKIPFNISPISNRAGSLKQYSNLVVFDHLQSSKKKTICSDMFNSINILFNGDLLSCCADWNRESILGNIQEHTIKAVIFGKKAQTMRAAIQAGKYDSIAPCKACSQAKNIMTNLQAQK